MNVDISRYEASKPTVLNYFNGPGNKDVKRTVSIMAAATSVPCIVIAYWLGPETNWHPDVLRSIKSLTDFYGYTEIKGKPEGSPV